MTAVTETALLAGRNLRRFARSPQLVADTLAFPIVLLLLMLVVFGEIVHAATRTDYITGLAPVIVLFSAAYGAIGTGLGFHADLRSGLIDRFHSMNIGRASVLTGRLVADLVRILLVAAVTTAVGYALGFRFERGVAAAVAFFAVALLFASMFLWLALLVALTGSNEQAVSGSLNAPITILLFLSSGFVPRGEFPGYLRPVVRANPMSIANDALIGLSAGGPVADPVLELLAWVAGVTIVLAPLCVRLQRRR